MKRFYLYKVFVKESLLGSQKSTRSISLNCSTELDENPILLKMPYSLVVRKKPRTEVETSSQMSTFTMSEDAVYTASEEKALVVWPRNKHWNYNTNYLVRCAHYCNSGTFLMANQLLSDCFPGQLFIRNFKDSTTINQELMPEEVKSPRMEPNTFI